MSTEPQTPTTQPPLPSSIEEIHELPGELTSTTRAPVSGEQVLADLIARLNDGKSTPKEQAMIERRIPLATLSTGELRAACVANPGHELAAHFANAVKDFPDSQEVHIEQPDLQALIQNRKTKINHQVIDGVIVRTKEVV